MAGKESGLPIFAAGLSTSNGRASSEVLTQVSNTSDMFSKWGEKGVVWKAMTPDFDGDIVPADELPKIIVMESPGLPNDDISRRGC